MLTTLSNFHSSVENYSPLLWFLLLRLATIKKNSLLFLNQSQVPRFVQFRLDCFPSFVIGQLNCFRLFWFNDTQLKTALMAQFFSKYITHDFDTQKIITYEHWNVAIGNRPQIGYKRCEKDITATIFVVYIWYMRSYTVAAKPIQTREL